MAYAGRPFRPFCQVPIEPQVARKAAAAGGPARATPPAPSIGRDRVAHAVGAGRLARAAGVAMHESSVRALGPLLLCYRTHTHARGPAESVQGFGGTTRNAWRGWACHWFLARILPARTSDSRARRPETMLVANALFWGCYIPVWLKYWRGQCVTEFFCAEIPTFGLFE